MAGKGNSLVPALPESVRRKLRLPRLGQLGFVVWDAEAAAKYYERVFGLGPWLIQEGETASCTNRGKPVTIRGRIGLAEVGGIEYELIQILEGESIHVEFLEERGEGLHHIGFFVRDLDQRLKACKDAGIGVLQQGTIRQSVVTINYAYLDTVAVGGVVFEYIEPRVGPVPATLPAWARRALYRLQGLGRR